MTKPIGNDAGMASSSVRDQGFFAEAPDLCSIAGFDGFLKEANAAHEALLGWSQAELLRLPYLEFVHPDDRQTLQEAMVELERNPGKDIALELRCMHKDGSHRWLSCHARSSAVDKAIYAVSRNVTEDKLRQAGGPGDGLLDTSFERAAIGIALTGVDGRFLEVNPALCEMLGLTREELTQRSLTDVTSARDSARDAATLDELIAGRRTSFRSDRSYVAASGRLAAATTIVALVNGAGDDPPRLLLQVNERADAPAREPGKTGRAHGGRPSPRELEILRLAAQGFSTEGAAAELGLSPATVKTHLKHVYEKLGVANRAAAVAVAFKRGLI